jgi:hypothetical protein
MIETCFAWAGASGVTSLSQEERHEPHMTLLSELKNVEVQNENKSIFGATSAVLRSLPAALDFLRNCTSHHPQLRIQVHNSMHSRILQYS